MNRPCILISCRVDVHGDIGEVRDAVDRRLSEFVWSSGFTPVLTPNVEEAATELYQRVKPRGLLLSGGNDLCSLGGDRMDRDRTEAKLVEIFERDDRPIFAICRGLQLLFSRENVLLERVPGHVRERHFVHTLDGRRLREVNSYHNFSARTLPENWEGLARTEDGCVEWARRGRRIQGIMWHPEREPKFSEEDIGLFRDHFTV